MIDTVPIARKIAAYPLNETVPYFGMTHYASASGIVSRCQRALAVDKKMASTIDDAKKKINTMVDPFSFLLISFIFLEAQCTRRALCDNTPDRFRLGFAGVDHQCTVFYRKHLRQRTDTGMLAEKQYYEASAENIVRVR